MNYNNILEEYKTIPCFRNIRKDRVLSNVIFYFFLFWGYICNFINGVSFSVVVYTKLQVFLSLSNILFFKIYK